MRNSNTYISEEDLKIILDVLEYCRDNFIEVQKASEKSIPIISIDSAISIILTEEEMKVFKDVKRRQYLSTKKYFSDLKAKHLESKLKDNISILAARTINSMTLKKEIWFN